MYFYIIPCDEVDFGAIEVDEMMHHTAVTPQSMELIRKLRSKYDSITAVQLANASNFDEDFDSNTNFILAMPKYLLQAKGQNETYPIDSDNELWQFVFERVGVIPTETDTKSSTEDALVILSRNGFKNY